MITRNSLAPILPCPATCSRTAIERLGARLDGTLRHHRIRRDGTLRDTVVYSILRDEWPVVKERLMGFLAR